MLTYLTRGWIPLPLGLLCLGMGGCDFSRLTTDFRTGTLGLNQLAAPTVPTPTPPSNPAPISTVLQTVDIASGITPSVTEGGQIQFTSAQQPVTWSLTAGSAGSINAVTGLYTAPAQITATNTINGCQARPNDDILSTPITTLPVSAGSAAWMSALGNMSVAYQTAWGESVFTGSTPQVDLSFAYTSQNNGSFPMPSWPNLRTEAGMYATGFGAGTDHHIVEVNMATCQYAEIYDYTPAASGTAPSATSGLTYSGMNFDLPNGATDAAGMFLSPLTLHLAELENGQINHALRFSMSNNYIAPSFVWPATANAYPPTPTMIPYGSRFRLKTSALNLGQYSPMAQTLLNQLEKYGLYLTDGAGYMSITADQDVTEDPAAWAAISEVDNAINGAGGMGVFEIVDESALEIGPATGAVKLNNGYITPNSYVQVVATPASGGPATSMRIALQGVGVGVPDPGITVASGATVQFQAWATGTTANSAVAWKTQTSLGSMTSSGVFTAPKVTQPTTLSLTAYSLENPQATQTVAVTLFPLASDNSLRISDNYGTSYFSLAWPGSTFGPDANGFTWLPDPGFYNSRSYIYCDSGGSGGGIFGEWCTGGPDWTHDFLVPNGNYSINLYIGIPPSLASEQSLWNIGAQGVWNIQSYNAIGASSGGTAPITLTLPATVTDNLLSFTLSNLLVNSGGVGSILSGFAIVPR